MTVPVLAAYWWWLIVAVLLAGAEIVVPGFFLIWLAAAALATGVVVAITGIGLGLALLLFAVLAVGAVLAGRHWSRTHELATEDAHLNRRGERLIGEVVVVSEPIAGGQGRVQIGDSPWRARGPDLPLGARVRIIGVSGTEVTVAPLD